MKTTAPFLLNAIFVEENKKWNERKNKNLNKNEFNLVFLLFVFVDSIFQYQMLYFLKNTIKNMHISDINKSKGHSVSGQYF